MAQSPLSRLPAWVVMFFPLCFVVGCGGSSGTANSPTPVQIAVSCNQKNIYINQTSSCMATVPSSAATPTFTWQSTGGTVNPTSGSPVAFSSGAPGLFTISASAGSNYTSGSNSVTVNLLVVESVTVACSPTSILKTGNSACSASVLGQGPINTGVSWVASSGTISGSGVFYPSGTGTVTITATSLQDGKTYGTTQITVVAPSSVSSITLVCSPALVVPTSTSTCVATVAGQGNYSNAVNWSANIGQISNGIFTPSGVERATITATSVQDPTKSASFVVDSDIQWTPGTMVWGADGQNSIGVYYSIPLSTQIANLKTVFEVSQNTYIMYRAWNYESTVLSSDLMTAQNSGIIPLVGFATYPSYDMTPTTCGNSTQQPGWVSWYNSGGEQEAYRWSYCRAQQAALDLPTNLYWYVGNEWIGDNYVTLPTACQNAPVVTGTTPAAWESTTTGNPCYPLFRGVLAGSIAGLQDSLGYVRIVPGMNGGNGSEGLAAALSSDLGNAKTNLSGRSLYWDFTSMHYASDAVNNANGLCADNGYTDEGPPDAYFYPSQCNPLWASTVNRDLYATVGLAGKPVIVTEISSSDGESPSLSTSANGTLATANGTLAGDEITGLLDNIKAHTFAANGEKGVVGGLLYELYQQPGTEVDRYLYPYQSGSAPGTLSAQGMAVQAWVRRNGNPTIMSIPGFELNLTTTSATTVSVGGSVIAKIVLSPASFSGTVSLSYKVWTIQPNAPTVLPTCNFSSAYLGASSPATLSCTAQSGVPSGTYIVSVYGSNGTTVVPANFTFAVQ